MTSQEGCVKKTNLLVYQPSGEKSPRKPCHGKSATYKPPICRAEPSQIRICTGKEMKRMNPPKLCSCGTKPGRGGLLQMLMFGLKAALAAGVMYVTYDLGIWGTTDDTQELYRTLCASKVDPFVKPKKNTGKWDPPSCEAERDLFRIAPYNPYAHCEVPPISTEEKMLKLRNNWNNAVYTVFSAVAGFPYNLPKISWTSESQQGAKGQQKCIPYNELSEEEKEKLKTSMPTSTVHQAASTLRRHSPLL